MRIKPRSDFNYIDVLTEGVMCKKHQLALVMPIYNEEGCILDVVTGWQNELNKLQIDYRMILINDGSKDGTRDRLAYFKDNDHILVINKPNSGHGPTILNGYNMAVEIAEWVFQVDSDNEMKPDPFFELWSKREKYCALFGIRTNRQQNIGRKVISYASRITVKLLFCDGVTDVNTPYRLIRSSSLKPIIHRMRSDTFAPNVIISGALAFSQVSILNIPVPHEGRKTGSVSIIKWKLWKSAFKSFWQTLVVSYEFRQLRI